MKHQLTLTLFTFLCFSLFAQNDSVFLFPEGVPGLKPNTLLEEDSPNAEGFSRLIGVTEPCFFPMLPAGAKGKTPAVVICPGGGYHRLSMDSEGFNMGRWFQERGIAAFVLKYRLPREDAFENKSIVPLQDVQQCFKLIREQADRYHIDPKNIGIVGFSAGGHLAASASVLYHQPLVDEKAKNLRPSFSILVYPVITFSDKLTHLGTRQNLIGPEWTEEEQAAYSCELHVDKKTPKTFLIHAIDDKTVPIQNSERYQEALERNGVAHRFVKCAQGGHGFGVKPGAKTNVWLQDLEDWLTAEDLIK